MTTYGEFGGVVVPPVPSANGPDSDYRREKTITTVVNGQNVMLIVRDTIVPEDPYLNMVRAAAYVYMKGGGPGVRFPVPPVGRPLKDALIKTNMMI